MTLGVEIRSRLARVARGIPVDTGTVFVAGPASSGADGPVEIRSIGDFAAEYGARAGANIPSYDYVDAMFGEGVNRAYFSRRATADPDITVALDRFDEDLGPGQLTAVGEVAGSGTYTALLERAAATNRFALLDVEVDDDIAAMAGLGATYKGLPNVEHGALFGSWAEIPAPPGTAGGTVRQVPASAILAGLISRADSNGFPHRAAAGRDFMLQYATGLVNSVGKADRETLLDGGVNSLASIYGVLENYGFQTGVERSVDNPYWQANVSRTRMWITAQARRVAEPFVFRPIDAEGRQANALGGAIDGELLRLYEADGLYGASAREAFATTVGESVNNAGTAAVGELHAVSEVRYTQHARAVLVDLVTVPITGSVSQ